MRRRIQRSSSQGSARTIFLPDQHYGPAITPQSGLIPIAPPANVTVVVLDNYGLEEEYRGFKRSARVLEPDGYAFEMIKRQQRKPLTVPRKKSKKKLAVLVGTHGESATFSLSKKLAGCKSSNTF